MTGSITVIACGVQFSFETASQAREWLASEWNRISRYSGAINLRLLQQDEYSQLQAAMIGPDAQRESLSAHFAERIQNLVADLPVEGTPAGSIVSEIASRLGDIEAAGALLVLAPRAFQRIKSYGRGNEVLAAVQAVHGSIEARVMMSSEPLAADGLRRFVQDFIRQTESSMEEVIQRHRTELSGVRAKFEQVSSETHDAAEGARRDREEIGHALSEYKRSTQSTLEDAAKRLLELEETYDRKLALEAPARYWKLKYEEHRSAIKSQWWLFGVGISASVILFGVVVIYLYEKSLEHEAGSNVAHGMMRISMIGFLAAILFWVLRVVSRRLHSHQHLMEDAKERRIMIMTYLALHKKVSSKDDRALEQLLATIFQPTADGIVRDDPGPVLPMQELLQGRRSTTHD